MQTVVNAVHKVTFGRSPERVVGGPDGLIARLVPFTTTTGNFRAERKPVGRWFGSMGRLALDWRARLQGDMPIYVVMSYQTPIAWVTRMGDVVIVPLDTGTMGGSTYTTTTHQGQVAVWLGHKLCEHGRLLTECMAAKAMVELKEDSERPLPPDHGERWVD